MEMFTKLKDKFLNSMRDDGMNDALNGEDYVEIDTNKVRSPKEKIIIRPFTMNDFSDTKVILDALREGKTIALVNIRPLKDKDVVELKRSVSKLKKTCDAVEGDIAGFGEDWIVVTPNFAYVHRGEDSAPVEQ
ncbi:cell division protein SepF [Candidatus Woesearchaeota archaeon]|nr:cell division protein SepF [Candidatus Woesearchaeota archaeon]